MTRLLQHQPPCDLPDDPHARSADFLSLLDEKLLKPNERLIAKLRAWGGLLDAAGWSVALREAGDGFWLSERAKQHLQELGDAPVTWRDLLTMLERLSTETVYRKGEGVIIWPGRAPVNPPPGPATELTRREAEVMSWLREGKTNPEIALICGCSTRTVEKHLANLYRKLGVGNRASVILNNPSPLIG